MRFAHIADNHLGFRQYGLFEREVDYYDVFKTIIDKILDEMPDFVIHSGDLFEFSRPPTKALLTVQEGFSLLKAKNIPIYTIAGNHDIIARKNAIPPQVLYKEFSKVISPNNPYHIEKGIFIGGIQYTPKYHHDFLVDQLNFLENVSKNYKKRILVLHQSIDKYLPFNYELELADIPESFNYYAMGHIHQRIIDDFGEGKLAYAGSPEIWKMDELESYRRNGKGFYLVDMSNDIPEVEKIDLKLPREMIRENVKYHNLHDEIKRIEEHIKKLDKKPLMEITIEGGNFDRSDVYEILRKAFYNKCLSLRPNYKPESLLTSLNGELNNETIINPNAILKEKLNKFNKNVPDFAIAVLKEISDGNLKNAEDITQKFYEDSYDN